MNKPPKRTELEKSLDMAMAAEGINRKELAVRMDVTGPYITKVMTDRTMSVRTLKLVCTALNIKVWQFMKLGEE